MERKNIEEVIHLWLADKKHYVKLSTYSIYSLMTTNHLIPAFKGITDTNKGHTELVIDTPKSKNSIRQVPIPADLIRTIKKLNKYIDQGG